MKMKNIALAASVAMLVAISGQALAAPFAWNAMAASTSQQTAQQDTHRYFGGPKSND
jgi:3-deoxy-D-arabino-heptulosonate 7-phosphate (DAHP) synthase